MLVLILTLTIIILLYFSRRNYSVTKIIPNLWLGDLNSAFNDNFLENNNIHLIINTTKNHPHSNTLDKRIKRIRVPISNSLASVQLAVSEAKRVKPIIDSYLKQGKGVLIHCKRGKHRSATILARYLIETTGMSGEQVKKFIKSKRGEAFTGTYFLGGALYV